MRYSTAGFLAGIFMLPFVLLTVACRWLRAEARNATMADVRRVAKVTALAVGASLAVLLIAGAICTLVGAL